MRTDTGPIANLVTPHHRPNRLSMALRQPKPLHVFIYDEEVPIATSVTPVSTARSATPRNQAACRQQALRTQPNEGLSDRCWPPSRRGEA